MKITIMTIAPKCCILGMWETNPVTGEIREGWGRKLPGMPIEVEGEIKNGVARLRFCGKKFGEVPVECLDVPESFLNKTIPNG